MIKKPFFVIFICLCLLCSGCVNKDVTVIKFSAWGSASEIGILKPIIREFESQNPNIRVEFMHIPQNYFQKLHLLLASNTAPDVIFINNLNLPVYAKFLEDLTPVVHTKDFYPKSIEGLKYHGKLLAIPRDISVLVVYYNKTLFKKYSVPFPDESWTLEDLFQKTLAFKDVYGISYEPLIYYALPFIHYYGGGILDENLKYIADSKNFEKGIKFYKDLAYKYHVSPLPEQTGCKTQAQLFLEGKIAMHISGRWLVPKYRECTNFDWDVVNFPKYSVPCDVSGWGISSSSSHKDAAVKFVLFLSNRENIDKMSSSGLIIPARIDAAQTSRFLNGKPEHSYLFLNSVKYARTSFVSKEYCKLIDKLDDKFFNN